MTIGRHRSPPPDKPPDRWIAPLAIAATVLAGASLIAIYAPGIAPDATAAARQAVTVSTASRSARTSVPFLPAPVPSIGAEGAWDPEPTPSAPAGALQNRPVALGDPTAPFAGAEVTTEAGTTPSEAPTGQTVTATPDTTPSSPADQTAAATKSTSSSATESTEETPVTVTAEPTPTDPVGDIVDEVVGETP